MSKVHCKDCAHYKEGPWQATKTGCWHPDNMSTSLSAAFNDEQQEPGDHEAINLRGDCEQYEQKAPRPSFWERFLNWGAA